MPVIKEIEHLMGCWRKLLLRSSAILYFTHFTLFSILVIGKEMVPLKNESGISRVPICFKFYILSKDPVEIIHATKLVQPISEIYGLTHFSLPCTGFYSVTLS